MPSLSEAEITALRSDERFQNMMIERLQQVMRGLPRLETTTQHLQSMSKLLSEQ